MAVKDELNKRKKLLWLIIILLLLIIAATIYLLMVYFKITPVFNYNTNVPAPAPTALPSPTTPGSYNQPKTTVLADLKGINEGTGITISEPEQTSMLFAATSFAERFGSFSNQSNYKNFDDLQPLMTKSVQNWVKQYIETLKKQNPDSNTYYALETKAISSEIKSADLKANTAEVMVKTQRQEFKNDINNPRVFYQDILLKILKENGQWLVGGVYWQ
ncbi:MAG: hypothetical protein A2Y67_01950 [Candidatus Buchananbacteria bacterium RBG_13_39_9]|uniref:Uncharacterized protein n=1 Tax=Candidatus Buchananbacteria bacterium RBG_13_39_9 TaxID=1797531 RepID=A0A1G1XRA3_9BACT|nr:MAG: hypothetical protein A2Y67_01950 [Candidatus Buchananbacteria bacterium RBG_13_39_9]